MYRRHKIPVILMPFIILAIYLFGKLETPPENMAILTYISLAEFIAVILVANFIFSSQYGKRIANKEDCRIRTQLLIHTLKNHVNAALGYIAMTIVLATPFSADRCGGTIMGVCLKRVTEGLAAGTSLSAFLLLLVIFKCYMEALLEESNPHGGTQ